MSSTNPPMFLSSGTTGSGRVNRPFTEQLGFTSAEFNMEPLLERIHPDDRTGVENLINVGEGAISARIGSQQSEWACFDLRAKKQDDVVTILGLLHFDPVLPVQPLTVTEYESGLQEKLKTMARIVEAKNLGMRCSILLVDWDTERVFDGAGPSLPKAYNEAVQGLRIGPMVGSCGTASFWNVPVIVENIAEDPLWVELRETAEIAGVAACWSHPITTTSGEVLGAMALYNEKPCAPEKHHMDGLEIAARMVGMAIEHERMESRIRQTSKMEAIGLLAGGVAHDFNNILSTILGNAELALEILPEGTDDLSGMLSNVVKASLSASELCNQMLGFAGKQGSASESIECNSLVAEIGDLTQVAFSKKIKLSYIFDEKPVGIRGDRSQLGQVIMNLLTNASDAIGNNEGMIVIGTSAEYYSQDQLKALDARTDLTAGDYVRIWVTDTGCGMLLQAQAKIFDPFYTTKSTGRGLGLAAVQGIIQGHNGLLTMKSVVDVGTTFTLFLPLTVLPSPATLVTKTIAAPNGASILVVDDDDMVLDVLKATLERAGYHVFCAADGQEGIDVYRQKADSIDCVILDLSMPKLDGEEVYRELSNICPDVKVILCSGYAKQEIIDRFHGANIAGVLKKPLQTHLLLEKIAETLH